MSAFLALVHHELLTFARDRMTLLNLVLGVGLLATTPVWPRALPERPETAAGCPSEPPAVQVAGPWPGDLRWPGPIDGAARVTITAEPQGSGLLRLTVAPRDPEVVACLNDAIAATRRSRLAAHRLTADPDHPVTLEGPEPPVRELPPLSWPGVWLASLAAVWVGGAALEMVPRRRQTGLLEQLRSTATPERALAAAWVAAAWIPGLVLWAAGLAVVAVAAAAAGQEHVWAGVAHVPALSALVAAASVRTSLHAADMQAAVMRWFGVMAAVGAGGAGAWWAFDHPALAAVVPFGGAMFATAGWLGPWAWLADLVSLAVAGALVAWCGARLAAEDTAAAGADPTLLRRARGAWGPEIAVLTASALTCAVISSGRAFGDHLWGGVTFAFVTCMLVPALATPLATGVPRAELLPLRTPRPREALGGLIAGLGLPPVGVAVIGLTQRVLTFRSGLEEAGKGLAALVETWLGRLGLAVYPAICEELLFRGAVFGLALRGGRPGVALIVQAAAFSIAHVAPGRLPWTFAVGLLFGALRLRTGSLVPGMIAHFVLNAIAPSWPFDRPAAALGAEAAVGLALALAGVGLAGKVNPR